jgi:hypothetical protein
LPDHLENEWAFKPDQPNQQTVFQLIEFNGRQLCQQAPVGKKQVFRIAILNQITSTLVNGEQSHVVWHFTS